MQPVRVAEYLARISDFIETKLLGFMEISKSAISNVTSIFAYLLHALSRWVIPSLTGRELITNAFTHDRWPRWHSGYVIG